MVRRTLESSARIDGMLRGFLASMTRYLVQVFTGLAVLGQLGIQTASLIAIVGAAGLAIGLALQGTLSNVAAGVMLLVFRPFRIGDYLEAGGEAGTVTEVTLFVTRLDTPDNVQIVIPNAAIWGAPVRNYSHHATRRVEMTVGIGYDDSIDEAMAAVRRVLDRDERDLADPEPLIAVAGLGESSVDLVLRVWCAAGDYGSLRFHLNKAVKESLDAAGISIPYPNRTVHLAGGAAAA